MTRTVGTVTATPSMDKDWKSFEVRFDGFAKLPAEKGEDVLSPEFTCFGHQWCLGICPGGSAKSKDGMVAVFIEHYSNTSITVDDFGFTIKDKEGNTKKEWVSKNGIEFAPSGTEIIENQISDGWGWSDFCERSDIIDSLKNGKLIIEVRMKKPLTKSTDNDGGKKCATASENDSNKQSAQQSAHESNENNSAEDNPEQPPLKKMRT